MDEPVRDDGAGHIGDQLTAPLHRDMLEDDQVDRQGAQPRTNGQGGIRHAGRAGRDMRPPARALPLVQVVLHPLRRRGRDLLLLERPGDPQVSGICQVTAARAAARRIVVLDPVRDLPRHGCPGLPGCLPRFFLSARPAAPATSRAVSALAGHRPRAASRSSRCSGTPPAPQPPAGPAGQRPSPPAPRSVPPAPRAAAPAPRAARPAPGSAHHADRQAAHPAADRSRHVIIPETGPGNHGSTAPDAET
jgi:hypothetical protein